MCAVYCLGWFDRLKYFKRLRWTVQLFSGDLSLTVKPGEPFQVDCPGYDVELINAGCAVKSFKLFMHYFRLNIFS